MSIPSQSLTEEKAIRRLRLFGYALLFSFLGTFGVWSATAPLSGAVVASGVVAVVGSVKKIQHQTGGTVAAIAVKNGDRVSDGQVLVQLDPTVTKANLAIVQGQLDALLMRAARLRAERDGLESFELPAIFKDRTTDAVALAALLESEKRLLTARVEARQGQQAQLRKRMEQLGDQIAGLRGQNDAKLRETRLINSELDGVRLLYTQNLVPLGRLNELERNAARIDGEREQIRSTIAELGGRIAETQLQILNLDQAASAEASRDLRDTEARIDEFSERAVAARDQLERSDIRAPRSGIVHQLSIHTVGGVVSPGETIMLIVPEDAGLTIEARILPNDIAALRLGQDAVIRLPGLNRSTTPELHATVSMVGADLVQDEATRLSYFPVQLSLPQTEVAKIGDAKILPGMTAEAYVTTATRTFLNYITQPLLDHMQRTMRET